MKGKCIEYLCKWAGFDDDECTWEPHCNLEKYDVHGYLVDVMKPLKEWEESVIGKAAEACFGKGDLHLDEENLHLSCDCKDCCYIAADPDEYEKVCRA